MFDTSVSLSFDRGSHTETRRHKFVHITPKREEKLVRENNKGGIESGAIVRPENDGERENLNGRNSILPTVDLGRLEREERWNENFLHCLSASLISMRRPVNDLEEAGRLKELDLVFDYLQCVDIFVWQYNKTFGLLC